LLSIIFVCFFLYNFLVVIANSDPLATIDLYDSFLSNVKIKSFKSLRRGEIRFLKYLPINGFVAGSSYDTTVNILNPNTDESIQKYTKHKNTFNCLDQIDEDTLVSGSSDNTMHIWEISTGETLKTINVGFSVFSVKSLSNDLIACGLDGGNIKIYEFSTENLTNTLIGHSGDVRSIELLNEQFMASGSSDTKVIIWDLTSYSIKYNLSQHQSGVMCVKRLSSNLMASSDYSGLIIIWNWLNGYLVHKLIGHNSSVYSLDLYDDQTLISGSQDKTIKLWNITNGQLIKTINKDFGINAIAMLKKGK
jgi:WD40 repeat protein